ncbi:restriction endonuclease subunit S [Pontibacterium sp. N1Y112]|uniref:Restriction endonuclease subunit S n=1 Tax=Pontibacterium sinense TaxID=2781979 RepID=A0A8J7K4R0_9GAMM|nr:restriction endonuclease subunit S [Pontibacterium sinense]MBE9395900.1 restriction endonuclease subunit S [Pontibacterium sinense]
MAVDAVDKVQQLLTGNIDLWTGTIEQKSSAGRGNNGKKHLHGIKKLRELILELAVRGKLVPQDSNDEPACVLLEQVAVERDRLVKENKIKKPKKLPKIENEEPPLELPEGWAYARLGALINLVSGQHLKPTEYSRECIQDGIPYITGPAEFGCISPTFSKYTIEKRALAQTGDILITCKGSGIGKTNISNRTLAISRQLMSIQPLLINKSYIKLFVDSLYGYFQSKGTGIAIPGISREDITECIVIFPPLQEQHRIVTKVDELMALCDQLEQQTERQIDAHQQLVDILLGTLTQSQNADALAENWARLSQHFGTLFTTVASIDQLKQTILQLAVMGKLVPQNPNDEPASELLKRIATEKEQLIKEKKIKKQKPIPPINSDERPTAIPIGWSLLRIEHFLDFRKRGMITGPFGSALKKSEHQESGVPVWGIESIKHGRFTHRNKIFVSSEKAKELKAFNAAPGDLIISRSGTIDEICTIPAGTENGLISTNLLRVSLLDSIVMPEYFCFIFKGNDFVLERLEQLCAGTTRLFLNQSILKSLIFPVPPLEEQHRIVTKVNELFTLCDQLKDRLQQNQHTQLLLTDTLIQESLK